MTASIARLKELLRTTVPRRLADVPDDTAANNHQRFVRAQSTPRLESPRYEQEFWVPARSFATQSSRRCPR